MSEPFQANGDSVLPLLSAAERRELLRLARDSVRSALRLTERRRTALPSANLLRPGGAFVSVYVDGQLRGCVGTLDCEEPLHVNVARVARAAALEDHRFPPIERRDVERMRIEISRLGPLRPVGSEEVIAGRHGVCVARGEMRGLLLPQVARRLGWDRQRLLSETCLKAGLPAGAWKDDDVRVFVFGAEVFGDEEGAD